MFRCKVMAFRVSDFYIGLLEHFNLTPMDVDEDLHEDKDEVV